MPEPGGKLTEQFLGEPTELQVIHEARCRDEAGHEFATLYLVDGPQGRGAYKIIRGLGFRLKLDDAPGQLPTPLINLGSAGGIMHASPRPDNPAAPNLIMTQRRGLEQIHATQQAHHGRWLDPRLSYATLLGEQPADPREMRMQGVAFLETIDEALSKLFSDKIPASHLSEADKRVLRLYFIQESLQDFRRFQTPIPSGDFDLIPLHGEVGTHLNNYVFCARDLLGTFIDTGGRMIKRFRGDTRSQDEARKELEQFNALLKERIVRNLITEIPVALTSNTVMDPDQILSLFLHEFEGFASRTTPDSNYYEAFQKLMNLNFFSYVYAYAVNQARVGLPKDKVLGIMAAINTCYEETSTQSLSLLQPSHRNQ